jgi:hypothetical protein
MRSRNHSPSQQAEFVTGQQGFDQMVPLMIPPPRPRTLEPRSRFKEEFSSVSGGATSVR